MTDDNLTPLDDTTPSTPDIPVAPIDNQAVPTDQVIAGHDTNEPPADSPESLDQEINQGAERENIDPHHSFDRPAGLQETKEQYHEDDTGSENV